MIVRFLKDHTGSLGQSWKSGEKADIWRQIAKQWIVEGIVEPANSAEREKLPDNYKKASEQQITVVHVHTTPEEMQNLEEE